MAIKDAGTSISACIAFKHLIMVLHCLLVGVSNPYRNIFVNFKNILLLLLLLLFTITYLNILQVGIFLNSSSAHIYHIIES